MAVRQVTRAFRYSGLKEGLRNRVFLTTAHTDYQPNRLNYWRQRLERASSSTLPELAVRGNARLLLPSPCRKRRLDDDLTTRLV